MIKKLSVLVLWIIPVVLGARLEVFINDFKEEVHEKVASEGANLMSRLETGVLDLQNIVTKHLNDLSDSLQKADSTQRFKRDTQTQVSESKFKLNFFTIINFVTCSYLPNIVDEMKSTVGNSTLLFAKIMGTAKNYSTALSNCSGNPICLMSVVLLTGNVVKDSIEEVDKFIADIRLRAQKLMRILLACATGEKLPTPPPMVNSTTTETPAQNTTLNATTTASQKNQYRQTDGESGESYSMENNDIKLSWR